MQNQGWCLDEQEMLQTKTFWLVHLSVWCRNMFAVVISVDEFLLCLVNQQIRRKWFSQFTILSVLISLAFEFFVNVMFYVKPFKQWDFCLLMPVFFSSRFCFKVIVVKMCFETQLVMLTFWQQKGCEYCTLTFLYKTPLPLLVEM